MKDKASMVMRVAAFIGGIFGAMAGFLAANITLYIASTQLGFGHDVPSSFIIRGFVLLAMSAVGFVGAVLAVAKPRLAVALLLTSVIVGVIASYQFYALASLLFLTAAILALIGWRRTSEINSAKPEGLSCDPDADKSLPNATS